MNPPRSLLFWSFLAFLPLLTARAGEPIKLPQASVVSLDGTWLLATDAQNVGRDQRWYEAPRPDAKPVKVPWIIQEAFPAYHGAAWYWLDVVPSANPQPQGRYLLRFTNVDYSGEVWVNNQLVGKHEGAETPFTLDVTAQLKPGQPNRIAVRVMNPDNSPTDGLSLHQTPSGSHVVPFRAGASYDAGGITGSVELLSVPAVRINDVLVYPDPKTGVIRIEAAVTNTLSAPAAAQAEFFVAPASAGETLETVLLDQSVPPGDSVLKAEIKIAQPKLWSLNDPYLYRLTARLSNPALKSRSETSVTCGFRDFRVENGYFRLNGQRVFLRSTHLVGSYPIGQNRPFDRDLARRDLIDLKMMGFNMIRFIWGGHVEQYQLDLCDQLGLMVYQETLASQPLEPSPRLGELFDATVMGVIRRDLNHPSIVLWGLLNEAQIPKQQDAFEHAVGMLPLVRSLDPTRVVLLNSGRYDGKSPEKIPASAQLEMWHPAGHDVPFVAGSAPISAPAAPAAALKDFNPTAPGAQAPADHSGLPAGEVVLRASETEPSVVRWTAPSSGSAEITAKFHALSTSPGSVTVSVLQNGQELYKKTLNPTGYPKASYSGNVTVSKGDTLDFVVSAGSASLQAALKVGDTIFDSLKEYSRSKNPNGPWSYGSASPSFALFTGQAKSGAIGSIANPGSSEWQDLITDDHTYPRVPHTADIIEMFRKKQGPYPIFLSEYGIGGAIDLWRITRQFERFGQLSSEEGQYYTERLNRYLADWKKWKLDEIYARPEDFFTESLRKMAGQRTLGLNAIRSNPNIIGYNFTSGGGDPVSCGEGTTTAFRELKPGVTDALYEGFAPLRWCLFTEPTSIYRGGTVHVDAVLANEDILKAGTYPALFQIIGPNNERLFEKRQPITVPNTPEPPLAFPVFSADIPITGPAGSYRFLATLEQGGAPTGGEIRFFVDDAALMPKIDQEVVLWGEDPILSQWLPAHGIKVRPFTNAPMRGREVILVGSRPPSNPEAAFADLARRIAQGATAIFLAPEVLQKNGNATGWLPLVNKGSLSEIKSWLYLKDEWAKKHPIFDGLPAGGLMDPIFYREIIPDTAWIGQDAPAEAVAGAIKASEDYSSGLMVSVYPFGAGRFILSNLLIRENLGTFPAAERLLRNMIRYAARDSAKPPVMLPGNFDAQLQAIGYK
ncbi:hypothetical protein BH09VER1_BH09VER1_17210 [soil metagenome]